MKIELVQLTGRDGDTAYNLERTLQAIATCAADTDLLIFPETQLMGFASAQQLAEVAEPLNGPSVQAVQRAVRERNVSVVVGMAENDAGTFYNTSLLVTPEGIALQLSQDSPLAFGARPVPAGRPLCHCALEGRPGRTPDLLRH